MHHCPSVRRNLLSLFLGLKKLDQCLCWLSRLTIPQLNLQRPQSLYQVSIYLSKLNRQPCQHHQYFGDSTALFFPNLVSTFTMRRFSETLRRRLTSSSQSSMSSLTTPTRTPPASSQPSIRTVEERCFDCQHRLYVTFMIQPSGRFISASIHHNPPSIAGFRLGTPPGHPLRQGSYCPMCQRGFTIEFITDPQSPMGIRSHFLISWMPEEVLLTEPAQIFELMRRELPCRRCGGLATFELVPALDGVLHYRLLCTCGWGRWS